MKKPPGKLTGILATILASTLLFLAQSFVGSLETKAGSDSKFNEVKSRIEQVDHKLDLTLCYLNRKHCLKQGEK